MRLPFVYIFLYCHLDHVLAGREAAHPRRLHQPVVAFGIRRQTLPHHFAEQSPRAVPLPTLRQAVQSAVVRTGIWLYALALHLRQHLIGPSGLYERETAGEENELGLREAN